MSLYSCNQSYVPIHGHDFFDNIFYDHSARACVRVRARGGEGTVRERERARARTVPFLTTSWISLVTCLMRAQCRTQRLIQLQGSAHVSNETGSHAASPPAKNKCLTNYPSKTKI